ncbi:MAG: putative transposase [Actinomycetota bacterium]|jgi:transposase-like protein|nr:putative transposase [Actinomycetota bacterium]
MTANHSIDPSLFLSDHLERAEPDLLRSMLKTFIEALMGAEADALCGAPYGARTDDRINSRNGYRPREWKPPVRFRALQCKALRKGCNYPS